MCPRQEHSQLREPGGGRVRGRWGGPGFWTTIVTALHVDTLRYRMQPSTARSSAGFILVSVLWILGALATLASIYAVYVINSATSMSVNDDRVKAAALISAALELTA